MMRSMGALQRHLTPCLGFFLIAETIYPQRNLEKARSVLAHSLSTSLSLVAGKAWQRVLKSAGPILSTARNQKTENTGSQLAFPSLSHLRPWSMGNGAAYT